MAAKPAGLATAGAEGGATTPSQATKQQCLCRLASEDGLPWCKPFECTLAQTSPDDARNVIVSLPKKEELRDEWIYFLSGRP